MFGDMEIPVISVGDEVIATANVTVVSFLCPLKEMLDFS